MPVIRRGRVKKKPRAYNTHYSITVLQADAVDYTIKWPHQRATIIGNKLLLLEDKTWLYANNPKSLCKWVNLLAMLLWLLFI